ncbi:hypothetical protein MNBD_GAMMA01-1805 [hydrothermal vent metagenome]|uniref:Uncharacterized protein n=1 Tax=hydrothermal vent metagenome TaxID=652676 RepID=A0A3B0V684_9ZZZZ
MRLKTKAILAHLLVILDKFRRDFGQAAAIPSDCFTGKD